MTAKPDATETRLDIEALITRAMRGPHLKPMEVIHVLLYARSQKQHATLLAGVVEALQADNQRLRDQINACTAYREHVRAEKAEARVAELEKALESEKRYASIVESEVVSSCGSEGERAIREGFEKWQDLASLTPATEGLPKRRDLATVIAESRKEIDALPEDVKRIFERNRQMRKEADHLDEMKKSK